MAGFFLCLASFLASRAARRARLAWRGGAERGKAATSTGRASASRAKSASEMAFMAHGL